MLVATEKLFWRLELDALNTLQVQVSLQLKIFYKSRTKHFWCTEVALFGYIGELKTNECTLHYKEKIKILLFVSCSVQPIMFEPF